MLRIVKLALKNNIYISEKILLCPYNAFLLLIAYYAREGNVWYLLNCHVISLDGEERAGCFDCLPL